MIKYSNSYFQNIKASPWGCKAFGSMQKQRTRKCCQTAFESRKISIHFYKPSAMKEQK